MKAEGKWDGDEMSARKKAGGKSPYPGGSEGEEKEQETDCLEVPKNNKTNGGVGQARRAGE